MTLPASGVLTMTAIDAEFGLGKALGSYRGTTWWKDDSSTGTFAATGLKMSDFYGKRKLPPVSAGVTTYTTGSGNYTVPGYTTLTIEEWGAGAGGGYVAFSSGTDGGDSTVAVGAATLRSGGGKGGSSGYSGGSYGGAGGEATGGDVNTTGGSGVTSLAGNAYGRGGSAPDGLTTTGGVGSTSSAPGPSPGAGGRSSISAESGNIWYCPGGGGAGAYLRKVYTFGQPGAPTVGQLLAYAVGSGGSSNAQGAAGGNGRILITVA